MRSTQVIVVPTLCGRTHGLLDRADHARHGVVLLTTGACEAAVERLYTELALYLHSAGITVLRVARSDPSGAATDAMAHAADVLGSVGALRNLGVERVAMIAAAETAQLSENETAATAFAGFIDVITARASAPDDYARIIAELVAAIGAAVDHIAGVIHLVPKRMAHRLRAELRITDDDEEGVDEALLQCAPPSRRIAVRLILPLPSSASGGGAWLSLLSEIYARVNALLSLGSEPGETGNGRRRALDAVRAWQAARDEPSQPGFPAAGQVSRGTTQALWRSLDLEWHAILWALELREPERAARVRAAVRHAGVQASRSSRYASAWRVLDERARLEWLVACAHAFPLVGHPCLSATRLSSTS